MIFVLDFIAAIEMIAILHIHICNLCQPTSTWSFYFIYFIFCFQFQINWELKKSVVAVIAVDVSHKKKKINQTTQKKKAHQTNTQN